MQKKAELRREFLARRLALAESDVKSYSMLMCARFSDWAIGQKFAEIFLYSPFRHEPDLTPLVNSIPNVRFAMPVVVSGTDMKFYEVTSDTPYRANKWGILEPVIGSERTPLIAGPQSLIVLPALAVDASGHRLGYGGGFYDRFLSKQKVVCMAVVFDSFKVSTLPAEDHDIRMDYVLTESGLGEC